MKKNRIADFLKFGMLFLFLMMIIGCNRVEESAEVPMTVPTNVVSSTVTQIVVPTSTPTNIPTLSPTVTPEPTSTTFPTVTPELTSTPSSTPMLSPTSAPDTEAPILTLLGDTVMEVIARTEFTEPGWNAQDDRDGDVTGGVQVFGNVDVNWCGTYTLSYEVEDQAGNFVREERTVIVKQPEEIIPEGKVIYMTFDDGPGKYTNEVLNILEKYNIKATFFTCGNGQPEMVTKIHEAGHTVAIHCRSHDYEVVYASEEAYFEDLFSMQDLVYECTGVRTTLVRFPGGSSNMASSFNPGIMTRLTEQLKQSGFQYFDWNVSSGDAGTKDTERILSNMIDGVNGRDCSVVLQHAETKEYSMKALEPFITWALGNGYTFLKLDNTSPRIQHKVYN